MQFGATRLRCFDRFERKLRRLIEHRSTQINVFAFEADAFRVTRLKSSETAREAEPRKFYPRAGKFAGKQLFRARSEYLERGMPTAVNALQA